MLLSRVTKSSLPLMIIVCTCACLVEGGHAAAVQEGSEDVGAGTIDTAGARPGITVELQDSLPALLQRLDHDELVQLMHRAAAPAHAMAHVRAQLFSGSDLALMSAADVRHVFNCSGDGNGSSGGGGGSGGAHGTKCFLPASNLLSHNTTTTSTITDTIRSSSSNVCWDMDDPRSAIGSTGAAARLTHGNLLEYARRHARSRCAPPSSSNRFLVWTCGCCGEPCSGWGNRLLGIGEMYM